jgi:hypothetical protein
MEAATAASTTGRLRSRLELPANVLDPWRLFTDDERREIWGDDPDFFEWRRWLDPELIEPCSRAAHADTFTKPIDQAIAREAFDRRAHVEVVKLGGEFVKAGHRGMAFEQGAEDNAVGNVGGSSSVMPASVSDTNVCSRKGRYP